MCYESLTALMGKETLDDETEATYAASELPCQSPRQPANHSPQECNT